MCGQLESYNQALELHWPQRKITQPAHIQAFTFLYSESHLLFDTGLT